MNRAVALAALSALALVLPTTAAFALTLAPGDVIITFPGLGRIDPLTGGTETIVPYVSNRVETAVGRSGLYLATDGTDIFRANPETGELDPVATGLASFEDLEVAPSGVITVTQTENDGSFVASRLVAVDPVSGATSTVLENTATGGPIPGGELIAVGFLSDGRALLGVRTGGFGGTKSIYAYDLTLGSATLIGSGPLLNDGELMALVVGSGDRIFAAMQVTDVIDDYSRFLEIDLASGGEDILRQSVYDGIYDIEVSRDGNTLYVTGTTTLGLLGHYFLRVDLWPTPGDELVGPNGPGVMFDLAVIPDPVPVPALRTRSLGALAVMLAGAALFALQRRHAGGR